MFKFLSRNKSDVTKWKINMLYDSECPLCMHEIKFLEKRNSGGLVKFTDIADPGYDPRANGGVDYETGMRRIYAVRDTGEVISGVAVFRAVYEAVGLGWVWRVTAWPGVAAVAEHVYGVWAAWRMWITGREELDVLFKQRRLALAQANGDGPLCDANSSCKINVGVKETMNKKIASKPVFVISKSYCPFCVMAKQVLKKYNIPADNIEIMEIENDEDCNEIQDYMQQLTGGRSVPRVFIGGECIGGGTETQAADRRGELRGLLEAAGAL